MPSLIFCKKKTNSNKKVCILYVTTLLFTLRFNLVLEKLQYQHLCTIFYAIKLTGGTQRLSRIVGPSIAKELIFTGRVIDGVAANQIGLVNHVVSQNEAGDAAYHRAVELAQEIAPQV